MQRRGGQDAVDEACIAIESGAEEREASSGMTMGGAAAMPPPEWRPRKCSGGRSAAGEREEAIGEQSRSMRRVETAPEAQPCKAMHRASEANSTSGWMCHANSSPHAETDICE